MQGGPFLHYDSLDAFPDSTTLYSPSQIKVYDEFRLLLNLKFC